MDNQKNGNTESVTSPAPGEIQVVEVRPRELECDVVRLYRPAGR